MTALKNDEEVVLGFIFYEFRSLKIYINKPTPQDTIFAQLFLEILGWILKFSFLFTKKV